MTSTVTTRGAVVQPFAGLVLGDALLVLDYEGAVRVADLVPDEPNASTRLTESVLG